ncbi:hypothetical protein M5X00_24130 [Paenibacillus alvei]|uniref:Uncharacterized protein n=1 Tax=Paenibacillus alvei TaxID=44250 RepID=A0ABT4GR30_PAEAL|nr:hypothetical protein [Paenibacillus alvei]MCY9757318.1 hypothetical protein [Paenibacillus alvei]MCY9759151.1 hypothetical protein [Paenibacillus alvei]MCY9770390.1 hypothetical protein [Paenibacillus alvei]
MFKSEEICKECGAELISLSEPQYGLCDDCIEDWRDRWDRVDPKFCIHGHYKDECETCLTDWE